MKSLYVPDQDFSLDESMVLWRGQLLFYQYVKKRLKCRIKFYELCESNGIILCVIIYCGITYANPLLFDQNGAIIVYLLKDILDKG